MKKIFNICLVFILIISTCVLNACSFKKDFSVYIFSSTGGYVTVDDSTDKIDMKEILYLKKKTTVKFTAHENNGYVFDYWEINSTPDSKDLVLELDISKETIVKAIFKKDTNSFTVTANNGTNYNFELISGYSWTVAHGGSVKFKLNITGDYTAEVKASGTILTPTNNVYTIENITSNLEITVALTSNSTEQNTYTATFINAGNSNEYINYNNIQFGQMINLASVESNLSKNNSNVKFYFDSNATNQINSTNLTFNYNSNQIFYYKHFYTVNHTNSSDYTINLENGYNWTVEEGSEIKFTISINSNSAINSVSYENTTLTPTNNVYTISNIRKNGTITVEVCTHATVKFTDLTNNLVSFKDLQENDILLNTNYYIELNNAFPFTLEVSTNMINLISPFMTYACFVDGTEIEYDENKDLYNFSVTEIRNYEIVVKVVSTLNFSFDYGTIENVGIMPETSYLGSTTIDLNVTKENNEYFYEINENNILLNVNGANKTIKELVTELNATHASTNHKITAIQLQDLSINTWCTIDYSTDSAVFTFNHSLLSLSDISEQSDNKTDFLITLIWD